MEQQRGQRICWLDLQAAPEGYGRDVSDGSVDHYDFEWGEPVLVDEGSIPCGCPGTGCPCIGPESPEPAVDPAGPEEPCQPQLPEQTDDPGYETVAP